MSRLNQVARLKAEDRRLRAAGMIPDISATEPYHRHRLGEVYLCQYPDATCNATSVNGTGYCAEHIEEMRVRACKAIRGSYDMDPTDQ